MINRIVGLFAQQSEKIGGPTECDWCQRCRAKRLVASNVGLQEQSDELVDEVQHRMDQVVEAAVEWHQAGREGGEWLDATDKLANAIDSLLELRSHEQAEMPSQVTAVTRDL